MPVVFTALADPTRREILKLLSGRELPAGQIAAAFPQQRPAISKHLAVLKAAGIIAESRDRQQRLYSIRPGSLDVATGFLATLQATANQPAPSRTYRKPASVVSSPPAHEPLAYAPQSEHKSAPRPAPVFSLDFD